MGRVFAMGDIHGSWKPIRDLQTYLNSSKPLNEQDTIILLGDVGANFFFNHRDVEFKEKLGKYKCTYFVIRGNHEQRPSICAEEAPEDWTTEIFWGNTVYVEKKYPYIKYALDAPARYSVYHRSIMVFPGAYSVDKQLRLQNDWSWFEREQLDEDEMQLGRDMVGYFGGCDLVLSHTCPICYEPTDLFLSVVDQSTVDKSMERYLGEIEYHLDYKLWLWGHYHANRVYPNTDGRDRVMLFNDCVMDLTKYFDPYEPQSAYDSLLKIHQSTNIDEWGKNR